MCSFFGNCLTIYWLRIFWWKKKLIGPIIRAIFTLISIHVHGHYCAMSQNLFWLPFVIRVIFLKFYFKKVIVLVFFNSEPNYIENSFAKVIFSNFGHMNFFCERIFFFFFLPLFWNETFCFHSFCWLFVKKHQQMCLLIENNHKNTFIMCFL